MGEAIVSALLSKGVSSSSEISVSEVVHDRRTYLNQKHGINVTGAHDEAMAGAEVVITAIKPQSVAAALPDMAASIKPEQLVLSIMAGVKISTLRSGLRHEQIVRSMPNTPAQIGEGMTVWTATREVTEGQKASARAILRVMGKEVYVDDENMVDMSTAVSGSGPAYFFLFLEALVNAAENIGIPRDMAGQMALQTMLGAGRLVESTGSMPADLRRMVTSPGGTTAEALRVFEEGDFNDLVGRAVDAAYRKARILGGEQA